MSILLVQHRNVDAGSVSSAALAYTNSEGAGNTNFVIARVGSTPSSVTVTDNNGNTYVADVSETTCADHHLYIFRASNVNSGACTVTVHQTGGTSVRFIILEYSGLDTSAPLDQTNKANGTSSPRSSGSITTTSANELLLTASADDNSTVDTVAIGNSFTIEDHIHTGTGADVLDVADLIVSSTLTTDGNWTGGTGTYVWDSVIASYKAAGGTVTNTLNPGADTLTVTDPPTFALGRTAAEALTVSDPPTLASRPTLSDVLTSADLWGTPTLGAVLSDPLLLADVAAATLQTSVGPDGLSLAETLLAAGGLQTLDALTLADLVASAIGPTLSDAVILVEALATAQAASGTDGLTLADLLVAVQSGQITVADSLSLADVVTTGLLAAFTDPLTVTEALLAAGLTSAVDGLSLADALAIIAQATANAIIAVDGLSLAESSATGQGSAFADPLSLVEVIASGIGPSLSDALLLADRMTTALAPVLVDPLALSDAIVAAGLMSAVDGLGVAEAWAIVNAATLFINAVDSLAPVDSMAAGLGSVLADGLGLSESMAATLQRTLGVDLLTLLDAAGLSTTSFTAHPAGALAYQTLVRALLWQATARALRYVTLPRALAYQTQGAADMPVTPVVQTMTPAEVHSGDRNRTCSIDFTKSLGTGENVVSGTVIVKAAPTSGSFDPLAFAQSATDVTTTVVPGAASLPATATVSGNVLSALVGPGFVAGQTYVAYFTAVTNASPAQSIDEATLPFACPY